MQSSVNMFRLWTKANNASRTWLDNTARPAYNNNDQGLVGGRFLIGPK